MIIMTANRIRDAPKDEYRPDTLNKGKLMKLSIETAAQNAIKLGLPVFICPNTNKPILGQKGDNKVYCGCMKANPDAPEGTHNSEARTGTHFVEYLKRA